MSENGVPEVPKTYYGKRSFIKNRVNDFLLEYQRRADADLALPSVVDFVNTTALLADVSPRFVERFFGLFRLKVVDDKLVKE